MKTDKFIELLNLYIDEEIDSSEVALLEAEIAKNSDRRKIYNEYCQIHQASCLLGEQFKQASAKRVEAVPVIEIRKPSFFASKARKVVYPLGGMAAALILILGISTMVEKNQLAGPQFSSSVVTQVDLPMEAIAVPLPSPLIISTAEKVVVLPEAEETSIARSVLAQASVVSLSSSQTNIVPDLVSSSNEKAVFLLDMPSNASFISVGWEPPIRLSDSTSPFKIVEVSSSRNRLFVPVAFSNEKPFKSSPFTKGAASLLPHAGTVNYDNLEVISFQLQK